MSSKAPPIPGFLTGTQAAQILEKLKVIRNVEGQTIKIQTIQTNPQTGAKQIVAIPIQSAPAAAGQNFSVSPMKTLRTSEGAVLTQGRTIKISSPRTAAYSAQVSIVKPSAPGVTTVTSVQSLSGAQMQSLQNLHSVHTVAGVQTLQQQHHPAPTYHRVTLTPQKSSAGAVVTQRFPRENLQFETVGVKRPADMDSLDMSESKRRKTEKGGGLNIHRQYLAFF